MRLGRALALFASVAALVCAQSAAEAQVGLRGSKLRFNSTYAASPFTGGTFGLWVKTSDGKAYFTNSSGVDTAIGAGGGGGTFSSTYDTSTPANNTVTQTTAGHGLQLVGPASATFPMLTLKQGATPGAGNYYLAAIDSASVTHLYLDTGGLLWDDAINGGVVLDATNAGSTVYAANIMQNTQPATVGTPVQNPPAFQWTGNVWTTAAGGANKSMVGLLTLSGVSGASPYEELFMNLGGSVTTSGRALTLSTGAVCSVSSGVCVSSANTATPTVTAGHFVASGTPTCSVNTTVNGTGGSCSVSGNDEAGEITVTTGTGGAYTADTAWFTLTVANACANALIGEFKASNSAAGSTMNQYSNSVGFYQTSTASDLTFKTVGTSGAGNPPASTAYKFQYMTRCR